MRNVLLGLCCLLLAVGAVTWWALESHDVAVVETRRADGQIRMTHVWWVTADDRLWLEAGSPSNGWFVDVSASQHIAIQRDGPSTEYVAVPISDPTHHRWIRSMIREKYGFRDLWVNLLVDTSESIAVRLVEAEHLVSRDRPVDAADSQ